MAALDGATKSLMQGVSQQVPRERLDGQVSIQTNMLSDVVEGMRRRPGMRFFVDGVFSGISKERVFATSVDIGDASVHILINTVTGELRVYNEVWALINSGTYFYLVAPSASAIQVCTLRGYLWICNTTIAPIPVVNNGTKQNPNTTGFFFVKAGQFSKTYNVTVIVAGVPKTATYTTPNGTSPGDASLSTPEYITTQLANQLATGSPVVPVYLNGAYATVQVVGSGPVSVVSDSGSLSIGVSNTSHVGLVSDLPARLASAADGMLISVGSNPKLSVWYQYDYFSNVWAEASAYNSISGINSMPIRMLLDGSYTIDGPVFEGRNAGNDATNEDPAFITGGITGMAAFQGRLVLLSGSVVTMSASGKPLRMYRSTVTELLVADPISIFSGAATTANFTHAVQFNKDLVLFSKSVQAVIPSGNALITPNTAQIVITSSYSCTTRVTPIVAGRSLMYFAPRSEKFAAALEMIPSTTTDSQYTTNDVTAHIPQYMPGSIRQATASTTSNSTALVADGDARSLFVQQYLWAGEEKRQSAWHVWSSPYDIVCTWFVRDTVFVGLLVNGALAVVSIDPQAGKTIDGAYRPFSDLFQAVLVSGGTFVVPVSLRPAFLAGNALQLTYTHGTTQGEAVGFSVNTSTWVGTVVRNVIDDFYYLGLKFLSAFSPTPPLMRDKDGVVIGTGAAILIRYEITTKNAGEFDVVVQRNNEVVANGTYSALKYSSQDLAPNAPLFAESGRVVVPVRINSNDAQVTLYAGEDHDLGLLTFEWVMQYHQRRRRA